MFTGIIETTGKIQNIEDKKSKIYFVINVKNFLKDTKIGASISCDGVCLTVIKKTKDSFTVELMPETLRLTKFADARAGDLINLEKSLKIGERVDGHFVMGHVDGVGVVKKVVKPIRQDSPGDAGGEGEYADLIIDVPRKIIKYLAYKGSASVNGVSLTISGVGKDWFKVSLITHTLEITNLSSLRIGDKVNLEIDMVARYLEKLIAFYRPLGRV